MEGTKSLLSFDKTWIAQKMKSPITFHCLPAIRGHTDTDCTESNAPNNSSTAGCIRCLADIFNELSFSNDWAGGNTKFHRDWSRHSKIDWEGEGGLKTDTSKVTSLV
jgi:hypothetical protein